MWKWSIRWLILHLLILYTGCGLMHEGRSILSRNPTLPLLRTKPPNELHTNRNTLLIVLPVIQDYHNITEEKLQYFYTKRPVTLVVEDATPSSRVLKLTEKRFHFEVKSTALDNNNTVTTTPKPENEYLEVKNTSLNQVIVNYSSPEETTESNSTRLENFTTESTTEFGCGTEDDWNDLWKDDDIEFDLKSDSVDRFKLPSKEQMRQLLNTFGLLSKGVSKENGSTRITRDIRTDIVAQMNTTNSSLFDKWINQSRIIDIRLENLNESEIVNVTMNNETAQSAVISVDMAKIQESSKGTKEYRTNETKITETGKKTFRTIKNKTRKRESRTKTFLDNLYKIFPLTRIFSTNRPKKKSKSKKEAKKSSPAPSVKTEVKRQEINFTKWAHEADNDPIQFKNDLWSEETSTTSSPTPNGLYFMVDWNKFLHVGQPKDNPVRVQYELKSGDPRRFMPIDMFNKLPGYK